MRPRSLARLDTVRAQILAQHDELQRLLRMSGALVGAAARGDEPCWREVPRALDTLAGKLHEHLAFEEATLFALLEEGAPARVDHQREEHARQRLQLTNLGRLAWRADDRAALATTFDTFVRQLGEDMAEEERWLLAQDEASAASPPMARARLAVQADDGPEGGSHVDDL